MSSYFNWLVYNVGSGGTKYMPLLNILYTIEYHDGELNHARYSDGLYLREIFSYETGTAYENMSFAQCSFLEMVTALARRIDNYVMYDDEYGNRTSVWFWKMLSNCGLSKYSGQLTDKDIQEIKQIVYNIELGAYETDGTGGLFKFDAPISNINLESLWTQAMWYATIEYEKENII